MKSVIILFLIFILPFSIMGQSQLIIQVKQGSLWGYIDIEGNVIQSAKFKHCEEFSKDGFAPVYLEATKKWAFIRPNGVLLNLSPDLEFKTSMGFNVEGFHGGMLAVKRNKLWGFVDTNGQIVIEPQYDGVSRFNDGYGWGERNGKFYILDETGNEAELSIEGVDELRNFSEGLIPFRLAGNNFGFLNTGGEVVIEAHFLTVGYFNDGIAWARDANKKLGFIDKEGKWIIDPQFDFAVDFDPGSELARVKVDDLWSYVTKDGESVVISDTELWEDFKEGLAMGRKGKMYGFFDKQGNWIISPQFEGVRGFQNGYAAAKLSKKWGIIDKSGEWVINPVYDGIKDVEVIR